MVFAIEGYKRRVYVHIVVSFRYGSSDRPATGQDGCLGCPGPIPHGGSSPVFKGLAPAVGELHISAIQIHIETNTNYGFIIYTQSQDDKTNTCRPKTSDRSELRETSRGRINSREKTGRGAGCGPCELACTLRDELLGSRSPTRPLHTHTRCALHIAPPTPS